MRSAPANHVKNFILEYLLLHGQTNIDKIQFALKRHFPEVYKKNSNLTQIHRHLRELQDKGFIISKTQYETLYSVSEAFKDYVLWLHDFLGKFKIRSPPNYYDFTEKDNHYYNVYRLIRDHPDKAVRLYESAFGKREYQYDKSIPPDVEMDFIQYYVEPIRKAIEKVND